MRGPAMYSDRPLRGEGPMGMCHDPSRKMFLGLPGPEWLFLWAWMASRMVTRLPVVDIVDISRAVLLLMMMLGDADGDEQ